MSKSAIQWTAARQAYLSIISSQSLLRLMLPTLTTTGIKHILCDSPGSQLVDVWNSAPSSLWTSPHVPFPFADFAFCPFIVINRRDEYNYKFIPVSSPRKSLPQARSQEPLIFQSKAYRPEVVGGAFTFGDRIALGKNCILTGTWRVGMT